MLTHDHARVHIRLFTIFIIQISLTFQWTILYTYSGNITIKSNCNTKVFVYTLQNVCVCVRECAHWYILPGITLSASSERFRFKNYNRTNSYLKLSTNCNYVTVPFQFCSAECRRSKSIQYRLKSKQININNNTIRSCVVCLHSFIRNKKWIKGDKEKKSIIPLISCSVNL